MKTTNKTPGHEPSGIQGRMPKAPGNAKAGDPPRREEAGGALPPWLDPKNAAWAKARVESHFKKGAGAPQVQAGSQLPDIPAHRVHTSAKDPKRQF